MEAIKGTLWQKLFLQQPWALGWFLKSPTYLVFLLQIFRTTPSLLQPYCILERGIALT